MQASHPQPYIHMNSKHCPEQAVSLRCPNPFLYCTAPVQNKLKNLAPALAGSVYTFQIIALTHRTEHQKEAAVIYIFFLVVNFKVHCRRAVRGIKPIHLLL